MCSKNFNRTFSGIFIVTIVGIIISLLSSVALVATGIYLALKHFG